MAVKTGSMVTVLDSMIAFHASGWETFHSSVRMLQVVGAISVTSDIPLLAEQYGDRPAPDAPGHRIVFLAASHYEIQLIDRPGQLCDHQEIDVGLGQATCPLLLHFLLIADFDVTPAT